MPELTSAGARTPWGMPRTIRCLAAKLTVLTNEGAGSASALDLGQPRRAERLRNWLTAQEAQLSSLRLVFDRCTWRVGADRGSLEAWSRRHRSRLVSQIGAPSYHASWTDERPLIEDVRSHPALASVVTSSGGFLKQPPVQLSLRGTDAAPVVLRLSPSREHDLDPAARCLSEQSLNIGRRHIRRQSVFQRPPAHDCHLGRRRCRRRECSAPSANSQVRCAHARPRRARCAGSR